MTYLHNNNITILYVYSILFIDYSINDLWQTIKRVYYVYKQYDRKNKIIKKIK